MVIKLQKRHSKTEYTYELTETVISLERLAQKRQKSQCAERGVDRKFHP